MKVVALVEHDSDGEESGESTSTTHNQPLVTSCNWLLTSHAQSASHASTSKSCAWREMWNCAAMAQQAGTQAATPNSQSSWSKGLKRSGLYYKGIVDDCHQVLELHPEKHYVHLWYQNFIQNSIKKFWWREQGNKDSKATMAIPWNSMIGMGINLKHTIK